MEHRKINESYRAAAEKLIAEESALERIRNSRVKITCLESDMAKKARKSTACGSTTWRTSRR